METEIKLKFNDKDSLYGVASLDSFRKLITDSNDPCPVLLENYYLDTIDHKLSGRTGMLRIRHYASSGRDDYEFTLKYGGGIVNGLHRRFEWNLKSSSGNFSINEFKSKVTENDPDGLLDEAFKDIEDSDLYVICSNCFNRTVYNISYGKSTAEACFDYGKILSRDRSRTEDICELELELKTGELKDIEELAESLISETGCVPFSSTKFVRTLALANGG